MGRWFHFEILLFSVPKFNPDSFVRHDQLGYIGPDRAYSAGINLPVPVSMFMPPVPQAFHAQQQMHGEFFSQHLTSVNTARNEYAKIYSF